VVVDAEAAYLDKTVGEDVQCEAPQELHPVQGDGSLDA